MFKALLPLIHFIQVRVYTWHKERGQACPDINIVASAFTVLRFSSNFGSRNHETNPSSLDGGFRSRSSQPVAKRCGAEHESRLFLDRAPHCTVQESTMIHIE